MADISQLHLVDLENRFKTVLASEKCVYGLVPRFPLGYGMFTVLLTLLLLPYLPELASSHHDKNYKIILQKDRLRNQTQHR